MIKINSEQLEQLKKEGKNILLDLYGVWCGPCRQLMPKLEQLEINYTNVIFAKMDIEENMIYVTNMGVKSVPTVIIYSGEDEIKKITGLQSESVYKEILEKIK